VTSVVTNAGALAAATAPGLAVVSLRKAAAGAAAAASYSRVGKTKRLSGGWHPEPLGINGARVINEVEYAAAHEFGAMLWNGGRLSAQPMARPSMIVAASA
jgi:hypothetical protein